MRKKTIGKLSFGPTVDITDPCYDRDVWCRMNKVSIKQGSYTCVVWSEDGRVGIIGIYLDGKIPKQSAMKTIGEIGVDAGLAGFFFYKSEMLAERAFYLCVAMVFNCPMTFLTGGR